MLAVHEAMEKENSNLGPATTVDNANGGNGKSNLINNAILGLNLNEKMAQNEQKIIGNQTIETVHKKLTGQ